MYSHLLAILRALRKGADAWSWWTLLALSDLRTRPRGPRAVTMTYLRRLGIVETPSLVSWEGKGHKIDIKADEWGHIKHCVRAWIRLWLLGQAATRHRNLQGAEDTDITPTVKLIRQTGAPRRQLCMLLADGVWTSSVHASIGWRADARCPFCAAPCEDIEHIVYTCPQWHSHRQKVRKWETWLSSQSNAVKRCFHCPRGAPPEVVADWPILQKEVSAIIASRDAELDALGIREEKPKPAEGSFVNPRSSVVPHNMGWEQIQSSMSPRAALLSFTADSQTMSGTTNGPSRGLNGIG